MENRDDSRAGGVELDYSLVAGYRARISQEIPGFTDMEKEMCK